MRTATRLSLIVRSSLVAALLIGQGTHALGQPSPAATETLSSDAQAKALLEQARPLARKRQWAKARGLLEKAAALAPEDGEILSLLGQSQVATRQAAKAVGTLRKALEKRGNDAAAAKALGAALEQRKDPRGAARAYLVAAREGKDQAAALSAGRLAHGIDTDLSFDGYRLAANLGALSGQDLVRFAAAALELKKYDVARGLYEKALAASPEDEALLVALARVAAGQQDFAAASSQLQAVLKRNPKNGEAVLALADVAAAQGDAAGEEKQLRALAALNGSHPAVHKRLARLLAQKGDAGGARAEWERQLEAVPNDADALRTLAQLALDEGKADVATAHAKALVALDRKSAGPQLLFGLARALAGDCKAAIPALAAGIAASDDAAPRAKLGACLHQQGQDAKARPHLLEAVRRDANEPLANATLGELALSARKYDEAGRYLQVAAATAAWAKDADFQVRAAEAWIAAGQSARAEPLLDAALKLQPAHPRASLARGRLLVRSGQAQRAVELLASAVAGMPKDADAQATYGYALLASGEKERALAAARAAVGAKAEHALGNEVLGNALFPAKEAKRPLELSLKGTPGAETVQNLAELQLDEQDVKGARRTLSGLKGGDAARTAWLEARVEYLTGDFASAESIVAAALVAAPGSAQLLQLGADVAYERGQFDRALERFESFQTVARAQNLNLDGRRRARFCELLAKAGKHAQAVTECQGALSGGYDGADAHANLGLALHKLGRKDESKRALDAALAKGANDKTTHLILGEIALAEGRDGDALDRFNKVLAVDPPNPSANGQSGQILVKRARYEEAIPRLEKAFAATRAPEVGSALARALLSTNRHSKAQKVLASLPEGSLPPAEELTLKGRIQHALGNYKKANDSFEQALKAKPGDSEALYHQGVNFLKLPHYEKAIALLEQSAKAEPNRAEVQAELARLYAETGQREKAAAALASAEAIETKTVEERRKGLPKEEIRHVAISPFKNTVGAAEHDWLSTALADALTSHLSKSAHIKLVERGQIEALRKEKLAALEQEDALDEASAPAFGKEVAADSVLLGSYQVAGETLQVSARMVDMTTGKVARSASRSGRLDDLERIERELALELLGQYVPLTEGERAAVARGAGVGNVDSIRLMAEAKRKARAGDVRAAQALYREAVAADAGNAAALLGLTQSLKQLESKNRIAIDLFKKVTPDAADWIGTGLVENLSSKLAQVQGIQIVERQQVEAVKREMLFAADEDNVDQEKVPEFGKQLAAGCVLQGAYQVANGQINISARLIDAEENKDLLGESVTGKVEDLFALSDELAEKIARQLIGIPSEEELAKLRQKKDFDTYRKDMEELARLREKERQELEARKLAEAKKPGAPAKTAPGTAPKKEPKKQVRQDPVKKDEEKKDDTLVYANVRAGMAGLGEEDLAVGGFTLSYYARSGERLDYGVAFGLQSTNGLSAGRDVENANAFGFYDLGFSADLRLLSLGPVWLTAGGTASGGIYQQRLGAAANVENYAAVAAAPRLGLELRGDDLALSGHFGKQWVFAYNDAAQTAPLDVWFVQLGIAGLMEPPRSSRDGDFVLHLGYRPHFTNANGLQAYRGYGGLLDYDNPGGALLTHGLLIGGGTNSLYLGFSRMGRNGGAEGAEKFSYNEVSWDFAWHAFDDEKWLNPTLGFRTGFALFGDGESGGLYGGESRGAWVVAPRFGLDMNWEYFGLTAGAGYDAVWAPADEVTDTNDPGGFFIDFGAALRL